MALKGSFNDMPLTDLIDVFYIGQKSGVLYITDPAYHASVYISYGRIIDASFQDTGDQKPITGDRAVLELLNRKLGTFVFTADMKIVRWPVSIYLDNNELIERSKTYSCSVNEPSKPVEPADLFERKVGESLQSMHNLERTFNTTNTGRGSTTLRSAHPCTRRLTAIPAPAAHATPATQCSTPEYSAPKMTSTSTPTNTSFRPASKILQAVMRRVQSL